MYITPLQGHSYWRQKCGSLFLNDGNAYFRKISQATINQAFYFYALKADQCGEISVIY